MLPVGPVEAYTGPAADVDGLYAADIGDPGPTIFDVSQINHRSAVPGRGGQ